MMNAHRQWNTLEDNERILKYYPGISHPNPTAPIKKRGRTNILVLSLKEEPLVEETYEQVIESSLLFEIKFSNCSIPCLCLTFVSRIRIYYCFHELVLDYASFLMDRTNSYSMIFLYCGRCDSGSTQKLMGIAEEFKIEGHLFPICPKRLKSGKSVLVIESLMEGLFRCLRIADQTEFRTSLGRYELIYEDRDREIIQSLLFQMLPGLGVNNAPRGKRILCLDGGGARGILPLEILLLLENLTGKKIHQMFDLICGTSVGGIIALACGLIQRDLSECRQKFFEMIKSVFSNKKSPPIPSFYSPLPLDNCLQEFFGEEDLSNFSPDLGQYPHVFVVSTLGLKSSERRFLWRNYKSETHGRNSGKLRHAARATSAAPVYFPVYLDDNNHHHLDGGIGANNPVLYAVHQGNKLWPNEVIECVVSIGTGSSSEIGNAISILPDSILSGIGFSKELLDFIIHSVTQTSESDELIKDLLPKKTKYFRFQPILPSSVSLDSTGDEPLAIGRGLIRRCFEEQNGLQLLKILSN